MGQKGELRKKHVKKNCRNLLEKGSCKSEIWEILRGLFPKYSVLFHSFFENHSNKLYVKTNR